MGNLYVRSTDGDNADNGSTWALAKVSLAGAAAIDAAGDVIYVSQSHAESNAATQTVALAGTYASPVRVLAGNDAAEPPTAGATASLTTTGAYGFVITGAAYLRGLTFNNGTGASYTLFQCGNGGTIQTLEDCNVYLLVTHTNGTINVGQVNTSNQKVNWLNVSVKFSNVAQGLSLGAEFVWRGGALASGGSWPNVLFKAMPTSYPGHALVEGVDLSNASASINLTIPPPIQSRLIFRNCKMPASWSGNVISTAFTAPGRVECYNCSASAENYALWVEDYLGSIKHELTLVRTGGASDGTTPIAWKMVSASAAKYPLMPLNSPEIAMWNATTGSAITVTVEILRDSATALTDAEIWLEVSYLSASGTPLGAVARDIAADVFTTPANQASSSETWTTTGMSNPNTQALAVTFTPQMAGFLMARVMLAKASTTVYVDPKLTVT